MTQSGPAALATSTNRQVLDHIDSTGSLAATTTQQMGIQDRDYMKRPSGDDGHDNSTPGNKLEAFLSGFLERHPRFFVYVGLGLVVLIIVAVVMAKLSGHGP